MDPVQDQYEHFPYPTRDPRDEDRRLVLGSPSSRDEINHFLFGGARDWSKPFRALVAGGGTGDALIMLAQQLADFACPAEIIYLDLSKAAREIAEARAARRGLTSISFITGSLLDAADHGPFDYIDCCGVLHHLEDPVAGFKALRSTLAPGGGMGVMVYGELGRTGVYDTQEMLRSLKKEGDSAATRIDIARRLLSSLPESNRLKRNSFVKDHLSNEAGLFDLLLHARDCPYRVHEIYEALDQSGLGMVGFVAPANYDPDYFVTDAKLKARLSLLNEPEREAFAELHTGNIKKHMFYCAASDSVLRSRVAAFDPKMIPVLHNVQLEPILEMLDEGKPLTARREGLRAEFPLPPRAVEILRLCDGTRTFKDIRKALSPAPPAQEFLESAQQIYRAFNGLNLLLLRARA